MSELPETQPTRTRILEATTTLVAHAGIEGVSMRQVATKAEVTLSVIYHYFADKDGLLRAMFDHNNSTLGRLRAELPESQDAFSMLAQRIGFQLDQAERIVAVLKYFMAYRTQFARFEDGYVPPKSYLHIQEVLERGVSDSVFHSPDIATDAKVMAHAINGFVLEYYPDSPHGREREALIQRIQGFLLRALGNKQPQ